MSKIYAIGEMLLRLDATSKPTQFNHQFKTYYGGAEYNVLVGLSGLGFDTAMLSIVQNSFVGQIMQKQLLLNGIDDQYLLFKTGNQGMYFVKNYFTHLPVSITYNRQCSVFQQHIQEMAKITFGKKNDWLLISGLSLLMAEATFNTILKITQQAKTRGLKLAFDFNYRSQLATYEVAQKRYLPFLKLANVIFASRSDFVHIFNYDQNLDDANLFAEVFKQYKLEHIVFTKRTILNTNHHLLQGIIYNQNGFLKSDKKKFLVVDRIGGGDAFAAGVLAKLIDNKSPFNKEDLNFAIDFAIYAQSLQGDNAFTSPKEIKDFVTSLTQDIKR